MSPEVEDALQSGACVNNKKLEGLFLRKGATAAPEARERLRAQIFAVLQELPDDMTVKELREELEAE